MSGFIGDVLAVILPAAAVHSGHPPAAVMVLLDVDAAVNAHSHTPRRENSEQVLVYCPSAIESNRRGRA